VDSREKALHSHGQPATSFASSQAALSSLSFPENKKTCQKHPQNKWTKKANKKPPTQKLQFLLHPAYVK